MGSQLDQNDLAAQIAKLAKMYGDGVLTEQDFKALKSRLIAETKESRKSIYGSAGQSGNPETTSDEWYFEDREHNERLGPHSRDEILQKISTQQIDASTLLWNSKLDEWTAAGKTPFGSYLVSFLAMVWLHDEHHDAQLSFFNEPIIVNSVLTDWIGNFLGNYDSAFDYRIARHLYAYVHQRNYG